jgi:hypothetical protein
VGLGAQAAPGAAQRVVVGLDIDPTRWLLLVLAIVAGTGRVLVRPADRRVDRHVPADLPERVSVGLQRGQDPGPGAIPLPAPEPAVQRLPWRVLR